jgi:hypothetical protein
VTLGSLLVISSWGCAASALAQVPPSTSREGVTATAHSSSDRRGRTDRRITAKSFGKDADGERCGRDRPGECSPVSGAPVEWWTRSSESGWGGRADGEDVTVGLREELGGRRPAGCRGGGLDVAGGGRFALACLKTPDRRFLPRSWCLPTDPRPARSGGLWSPTCDTAGFPGLARRPRAGGTVVWVEPAVWWCRVVGGHETVLASSALTTKVRSLLSW